ncbi:MAG: TIM barrel protein [Rhodothermales bacterium]
MNRRHFLNSTAAAVAYAALPVRPALPARRPMGVTVATYAVRWNSETQSATYPALRTALDILEDCARIGAGGAQVGVSNWETDFAGKVRDRREQLGLYLEGQIRMPRVDEDLDAFEQQVRLAREAGATILRAVCLGPRRYETLHSMSEFLAFKEDAWKAVERIEPIMRRNRVQLAIENHKDWRAEELVALMWHLGSEWMGVTLDMGNNIALLEDPMTVVEQLAPYAITTHFKDMAVAPYDAGFLLSEVPLGEGLLDLPRMVEICERHNPAITFNLEMITRDPLKVPCMTEEYWSTFDYVGGRDLAWAFRYVSGNRPKQPLPTLSEKSPEGRLAYEDENNLRSFAYSRDVLGMK